MDVEPGLLFGDGCVVIACVVVWVRLVPLWTWIVEQGVQSRAL